MAEVWPYIPLDRMAERLSWLTAVHQREDDTSRWNLRSARQVLDLAFAFEAAEWEGARALFRSNVLGDWQVPCWWEATRDVAVSGSDTVLAVSTAAEYVAGGQAIVWATCDAFTVVDVAAVEAGEITLSGAVGTDYAAALVMPLRTCFCREGMQTERRGRDFYRCRLAFEARDNPDVTQLVEPLQVQIAIDSSTSMNEFVSGDVDRFAVACSNAIGFLSWLEATGLSHDVRVVAWNDTATGIERTDCDAADYADLRAFIAARTTGGDSTEVDQAFDGAAAFFTGSVRRVFLLVTDGEIGEIAAAQAIRDSISGLEVYGANIELADTSATDQIVTEGATQVIAAGGVAARDFMVMSILGLVQSQGELFLQCGGAVLAPLGGRILQAATFIDSGFGSVAVEPERSYLEEAGEITLAENTIAGRWLLKQQLHFLAGQDRPFRVAEKVIRVIASTTTQITIAALRPAAADWVGVEIEIDGAFRTVSGAALVSGNHRLTVATLAAPPAGPLRVLRRVRQLADEITLQHHRRGGWTTTRLLAGTP